MKKLWEKQYCLRAGDFDKFDRIKPSSVLDLFQDAAGQHAMEIGVGFDDMLKKQYLWVIVRVKFEILSMPKRYSTVNIKTWPLEPNRLNYGREYCIEDLNGQKLIVGSSQWVVMHSEKRSLLSVPDLYSFKDGFVEEKMFDEKLSKIRDFEHTGEPYVVNAGYTELDLNDHVNNANYANYVLDALSPKQQDVIKSFQIDYRKEVMQSTRINVYCLKEANETLAKGLNNNGETLFACKINFN